MNAQQIARQIELLNQAIADNDNGMYDGYIAMTLGYLRDHQVHVRVAVIES